MTLAQISYFVKVAELGHLTQAAGEFMIAQPSLTQAIRKLEEEMGFPEDVSFSAGRGANFFPMQKGLWSPTRWPPGLRTTFMRKTGG